MQPNGSPQIMTPITEPLSMRFHQRELTVPRAQQWALIPKGYATGPVAKPPVPPEQVPGRKRGR